MADSNNPSTNYQADDISHIAEGYRPTPTRINSEQISDEEILTETYFDGYPQLVTQQVSEPQYNQSNSQSPPDLTGLEPEEALDITRDETIELSDGTSLAVNIYRPKDAQEDEELPALLAWGMWGKDVQEAVCWLRSNPQPYQETPFWDGSLEAGDTPYLADHGFIHVIPDPRGIGDSEGGPITNLLDLHDPEDLHTTIEWIADQSWCNGSVGMIGPSSYAFSQAVIGQNPPAALNALFPIAFWAIGDYTFTGVRDASLYNIFHGGHMHDSTHPLSVDNYTEPLTISQSDDDELQQLLDEVTRDPDIKYNSKFYSVFQYPMKDPLAFDLFVNEWFHPHGAPSDLSEIEMPTYIGGVLPGGAHHRLYWEAFEAWERANIPDDQKKLLILPPGELARPFVDYHDEIVRWNDQLLRDGDNGIDKEPSVKTFVMGIDKWSFEDDWPPERVDWTDMHLHSDGQLRTEPANSGQVSWHQPKPIEDDTVYCTKFATSIDEVVELMGPISLHLEAAIDAEDTNWIADLVDVSPDGHRQLVSQGWLRASYRGLDEDASTPGWPVHTTDQQPVAEGETHEYSIAMAPTSAVIKAGHDLELVLRNQDDMSSQLADRGVYFLPLMRDVTHTVEVDGGSYLRLPVTGRGTDIEDRLDNGKQFR